MSRPFPRSATFRSLYISQKRSRTLTDSTFFLKKIFTVYQKSYANLLPVYEPVVPAAWPRVTVLIPARNEAEGIGRTVRSLLAQDYPTSFPLKHMQKDLRLALALGEKLDQNLALTSAGNELFKRARIAGHGDEDIGAVYEAIR